MRYSSFVPRLYNLCRSFGFTPGQIMPSRAMCSDESQGFPIILITKHFGAFPFNHGRAGGIVATDRHGPHAHHGQDLLLIQASHVGYDPDSKAYGHYCRLQTSDHLSTATCGRIGEVLQWYMDEFTFASTHISLGIEDGRRTVAIDNQLLDQSRSEGLFLDLSFLLAQRNGEFDLVRTQSTSHVYLASDAFIECIGSAHWPHEGASLVFGQHLQPPLFKFKRQPSELEDEYHWLERNLLPSMPWIVTAKAPMLTAAQVNTITEFDRTYRTLVKSSDYSGKNLFFISCLNIDISPKPGQVFPLTKCVPWAAYLQGADGSARIYEQKELCALLREQSEENPDQIDLEAAILRMINAPQVLPRSSHSE